MLEKCLKYKNQVSVCLVVKLVSINECSSSCEIGEYQFCVDIGDDSLNCFWGLVFQECVYFLYNQYISNSWFNDSYLGIVSWKNSYSVFKYTLCRPGNLAEWLFVTTLFPSLIKDCNDNLFPQIHLHNTNAFFEDLTGKHFYNLAYKLHFLHTDLPTLHKRACFSTTISPLLIYL